MNHLDVMACLKLNGKSMVMIDPEIIKKLRALTIREGVQITERKYTLHF